jgi:hypothetical protein
MGVFDETLNYIPNATHLINFRVGNYIWFIQKNGKISWLS